MKLNILTLAIMGLLVNLSTSIQSMQQTLTVYGTVEQSDKTVDGNRIISFQAECVYQGSDALITITKTIDLNRQTSHISGIVEPNNCAAQRILLSAFQASTPFDQLSGHYLFQLREAEKAAQEAQQKVKSSVFKWQRFDKR